MKPLTTAEKRHFESQGKTPLHLAVIEGNLEEVRRLVEEAWKGDAPIGNTVDAEDAHGNRPLHEPFLHDGERDFMEDEKIIEFLCSDRGGSADPNARNHALQTPLQLAAEYRQLNLLVVLRDYGGSPNIPDGDGFSAVHLAENQDWQEGVEFLARNGGLRWGEWP